MELIISVLALVLSLSSWIYTLITQHKNVHMSVYSWWMREDILLLKLMIANKSRLAITITDLQFTHNNHVYSCFKFQQPIGTSKEKRTDRVIKECSSAKFPIAIPSLSGDSYYVLFEKCTLPADATKLILEVHTNRGKLTRTLQLPPLAGYEECLL